MKLKEKLAQGVLLSDGSMGALLSFLGYGTPCPDELTVTHPEVIASVHESYLAAGSDIVIADCFGSTEPVLKHKGKAGRTAEFTDAAVRLAKACAGEDRLAACDMGPTGEFMFPVGERSFDEVYGWFSEQARTAKTAGADFAYIETQTDLAECRAACLAARDAGLEVIASFSLSEKGRTLTGASAEACAVALQAAGATALGINCSTGPEHMLDSVKRMRKVTNLPLAVQPNAGLPVTHADGTVTYPYVPEELEKGMRAILAAGASIIGGCCGTTPDHIARLKPLTGGKLPENEAQGEYLCSAREIFDVREALSCPEHVSDPEDAYDVDDDTTIIEINAADFTVESIMELNANTKLPLLINADTREHTEQLLRAYAGRPAVRGCAEAAAAYGAYAL